MSTIYLPSRDGDAVVYAEKIIASAKAQRKPRCGGLGTTRRAAKLIVGRRVASAARRRHRLTGANLPTTWDFANIGAGKQSLHHCGR